MKDLFKDNLSKAITVQLEEKQLEFLNEISKDNNQSRMKIIRKIVSLGLCCYMCRNMRDDEFAKMVIGIF